MAPVMASKLEDMIKILAIEDDDNVQYLRMVELLREAFVAGGLAVLPPIVRELAEEVAVSGLETEFDKWKVV